MLRFDNIDQYSLGYTLYFYYLKSIHNGIYYDKIIVKGRENIPPKGEATFIIPNHQNGVMDAFAVLHLFDGFRQPVFIARGDVFANPHVAKFLRFLKIMPTFRTRDGGRRDIAKNTETFDIAASVLNRNGTLCMFPEAMHQHGHYLGDFKKGYPRIAFAAAEKSNFETKFKILPISIHYSHYEHIGTVQYLQIGKPFTYEELYELYRNEPNKAYAALNEKSHAALKSMVLDIEDKEHYHELNLYRKMCANRVEAEKGRKLPLNERLDIEKSSIEKALALQNDNPEKYQQLNLDLQEYSKGLEKHNLRDWVIDTPKGWGYALLQILLLLIGLPFYLYSLVANYIPYIIPEMIVKKVKDHQLHASVRYAPGTITFFIWYLILLAVIWPVSGSILFTLGALALGILTIPTLYFYKARKIKLCAWFKYRKLRNGNDIQTLIKLKNKILSAL